MEGFEATCEKCGAGQFLDPSELPRVGADGSFTCDACAGRVSRHVKIATRREVRRRRRLLYPDPWRRSGCIVTARRGTKIWTCHRDGKVEDALREICATLPEGTEVVSISTWRSILRDLTGMPRMIPGNREVDPYSVERTLLAKVGRLDLLPPAADPLFDQSQRERKRGIRRT